MQVSAAEEARSANRDEDLKTNGERPDTCTIIKRSGGATSINASGENYTCDILVCCLLNFIVSMQLV